VYNLIDKDKGSLSHFHL